jgi:hypothetical protein
MLEPESKFKAAPSPRHTSTKTLKVILIVDMLYIRRKNVIMTKQAGTNTLSKFRNRDE